MLYLLFDRYAFTVIANVTIYTIAWLLLDTTDVSDEQEKSHLGPDDAPQFRVSAIFTILKYWIYMSKQYEGEN